MSYIRRLTVSLNEEDRQALAALAEQQLREPKDQALYIIRQALAKEQAEKPGSPMPTGAMLARWINFHYAPARDLESIGDFFEAMAKWTREAEAEDSAGYLYMATKEEHNLATILFMLMEGYPDEAWDVFDECVDLDELSTNRRTTILDATATLATWLKAKDQGQDVPKPAEREPLSEVRARAASSYHHTPAEIIHYALTYGIQDAKEYLKHITDDEGRATNDTEETVEETRTYLADMQAMLEERYHGKPFDSQDEGA